MQAERDLSLDEAEYPMMSDVVVKPVQSRREKRLFLEFPWQHYGGDPHWIPPLRSDDKRLVGYRPHPFYEKNECQTFLAFRGGEVCGRIAAIHNRAHNEHFKEQRGFFGFFECCDDRHAAHALFDAARDWLARRDLRPIRGPTSPGLNYLAGTLIEGFDSPPTFMMPYNPPYYPALIEGYGFRKAQDLYAYSGTLDMLAPVQAKLEPVAAQIVERLGVRIRTMNRWRFKRDVAEFLSVFNRSAVGHWGFAPFSQAEVDDLAKGLSWLLVPEMAVGAEVDGKLVGVAIVLPDYNPRIRQIDGRLFPFGFLRLLANKRKIKKVRSMTTNVLPEYHLLGVGLVLLRAMVPKGLEWGTTEVEFSWVAESNALSRGALEKGGAKRSKTYRVYDLDR
jgi:GNAT superfamily N-acetyltransferase